MGDLTVDAVPLGNTPPPDNTQPQSPSTAVPKQGRHVFNITGSHGVHIGPVIHNVSVTRNPRPNAEDMPLKRDVDALQRCHRQIEDRDKYIASEHLGSCWKSLGRAMGFSEGQIENVEADFPRNADRANELLCKWHDRESDRATVSRLTQLVIDVRAYHLLNFLKP